MMIEPTETESKESLDKFIAVMEKIYEEAWEIEEKYGSLHFQRSEELLSLHEQYANKEEFFAEKQAAKIFK